MPLLSHHRLGVKIQSFDSTPIGGSEIFGKMGHFGIHNRMAWVTQRTEEIVTSGTGSSTRNKTWTETPISIAAIVFAGSSGVTFLVKWTRITHKDSHYKREYRISSKLSPPPSCNLEARAAPVGA